jgi:hypothetical protein
MSSLDEVAPGLSRFTVTRNGLPPTMTAYALRDGEDTILVDPLVAGETEPLLAALDEIVRGRVRILVTTPFHVRGSQLLWRRWRDRHEVTIFGHEYCATRLDDRSAFRPLRGGAPRSRSSCRRTAPWPSATRCSRPTASCAYGRGIAMASVAAPGTSSASCRRWTR